MPKKLYSTAEAANYLGISVSALKYHIYFAEDIAGQLVGRTLVFTEDELEKFNNTRRPQGRPRKEKSE